MVSSDARFSSARSASSLEPRKRVVAEFLGEGDIGIVELGFLGIGHRELAGARLIWAGMGPTVRAAARSPHVYQQQKLYKKTPRHASPM